MRLFHTYLPLFVIWSFFSSLYEDNSNRARTMQMTLNEIQRVTTDVQIINERAGNNCIYIYQEIALQCINIPPL